MTVRVPILDSDDQINLTHLPSQVLAQLALNDVIAYDTFNRANAASPGTADSGHAWTDTAGVVTITSNRLKDGTAGGSGNGFAYVDAGIGNGICEATIRRGATYGAGIGFRITDANNGLFVLSNAAGTSIAIYKRVAGVNTSLATATFAWPAAYAQDMRVTVRGDLIRVICDGAVVVSHTLSSGDLTAFPTTLTKWGFYLANGGTTYDNFVLRTTT